MKRKTISVFIMMLLLATGFTFMGTADNEGIITLEDPNFQGEQQQSSSFDLWDVQFQYDVGGDTGSLYLAGTIFDGTYFYCPEFNSATVYRFDIAGNYVDSITIPGVSSYVEMAYDGEFVYALTTGAYTIYKINMTTQTVVSTISISQASYNIGYDADADGGNGGFWLGQWQNHLTLVDMSGNVLDSLTPPDSFFGVAYDSISETPGYNGPFLWLFTGTSTGGQGIIKQYDLDTETLTGVEHNVALDLGMGIAGGLFTTTDFEEGTLSLCGLTQGADPINDYIFGYEICETGPLPQNVMISSVEEDWNIFSLPFNYTVPKANLTVNYAGTNYTWAEAVTNGYVSSFVFGWDRNAQTYFFADDLVPGEAYWLFMYDQCELWMNNITIYPEDIQTDLSEDWNLVGLHTLDSVPKANLTIAYGGTDYSWADAVTNGYVSQFVFGWDRTAQTYQFADTLDPGFGYWMYNSVDCTLKYLI
jgi:hypothetical protein